MTNHARRAVALLLSVAALATLGLAACNGGSIDGALYGLTPKGDGVAFVRVEPTTGVVTEIGSTTSVTPTEIQYVDASANPNSRRYAAYVNQQETAPSLVTFDPAEGALLSKVVAPKEAAFLAPTADGADFFTIQLSPSPTIGTIDPVTAKFTEIGGLAGFIFTYAITTNGSDRFYVVGNDGLGGSPTLLLTVDLTNGTNTYVTLPEGKKYVALRFDSELDALFALTWDAGEAPRIHLEEIDRTSGALRHVAALPVTPSSTAPEDVIAFEDLGYDSDSHHLFVVIKGVTDQLFVVDATTGHVDASPMIGAAGGSIHGLVYIP